MTTHSSILAWKMPRTEEPDHVAKRRTQLKRLSMHGCKDVSHFGATPSSQEESKKQRFLSSPVVI